jgi:hypothetical protein
MKKPKAVKPDVASKPSKKRPWKIFAECKQVDPFEAGLVKQRKKQPDY